MQYCQLQVSGIQYASDFILVSNFTNCGIFYASTDRPVTQYHNPEQQHHISIGFLWVKH